MDILSDLKKEVASKIAYKFVKSTVGCGNIKNLNVEMEEDNITITFEGDVTISRDELVKLIFGD